MDKNKLSLLLVSVLSGMYLTQCTSLPTAKKTNPYAKQFGYPETRVTQDEHDPFLEASGMGDNTLRYNTKLSEADNPVSENIKVMPRDNGVDNYYGDVVVDKYRWLEEVDEINPEYSKETSADRQRNLTGTQWEDKREDATNHQEKLLNYLSTVNPHGKEKSEVTQWVDAQNQATKNYMSNIPIYSKIKSDVDALMDYEYTHTKPEYDSGKFAYIRDASGFYKLYRTPKKGGERTVILDEGAMFKANGSKIYDLYFSPNGDYVAYVWFEGNSDADRSYIDVIDARSGKKVTNTITRAEKGAHVTWRDEHSFYYVNYDNAGWNLIQLRDINKDSLHDKLVYKGSVSDISIHGDNKYLVIEQSHDFTILKDLKSGRLKALYTFKEEDAIGKKDAFTNYTGASLISINDDTNTAYIRSEYYNANGEVLEVDIDHPKNRRVVIPATGDRLVDAAHLDGKWFLQYFKDGYHKLIIADKDGKFIKDITPGKGGAISELDAYEYDDEPTQDKTAANESHSSKAHSEEEVDDKEKEVSHIYFRFESPIQPRTEYKYSVKEDRFISIKRKDTILFDPSQYEIETGFYKSSDGTQIPINIAHKKGIKLDGSNPTILYGYGGFSLNSDPWFYVTHAAWLEQGGIWAIAGIRGGYEYGEDWHLAGKKYNKMNVFNDFIAGAEYLIKKGYTSKERLAINGASNGGLLVGATMTLRPDLFRVAFPEVGVLDMLRHDKGKTGNWIDEYGITGDGKEMYKVLKSYSPYHNVKDGVCYPSTIVMTSKRDDRVLPWHSYKFAAALQEKQACDRPVFLFAEEFHGHGPNTRQETKDNWAMKVAFALNEMGIKEAPKVPEHLKEVPPEIK